MGSQSQLPGTRKYKVLGYMGRDRELWLTFGEAVKLMNEGYSITLVTKTKEKVEVKG